MNKWQAWIHLSKRLRKEKQDEINLLDTTLAEKKMRIKHTMETTVKELTNIIR